MNEKLTVEIKNKFPVELADLTNALFSFGDQYKRFALTRNEITQEHEAKLYIKEIRTGSIITDLVAYTPLILPVLPVIANVTTVLDFCSYLKKTYDFFLGKPEEKPSLDKVDCEQLSSIINPVAKDAESQINITYNQNAPINMTININSMEANAVQNKISKYLSDLKEPVTRTFEDVVLYWFQARNSSNSQSGDKAVIESIYSKPVKIIFTNDELKGKMLFDNDNPFKFAYIVSVSVETVGNLPVAYKLLGYKDKFELP